MSLRPYNSKSVHCSLARHRDWHPTPTSHNGSVWVPENEFRLWHATVTTVRVGMMPDW